MEPQESPYCYRVEVSGWDASENFFVEKTTLKWDNDRQKEITLQSSLREGCLLFVRLLQSVALVSNVPVAYQVLRVQERDSDSRIRVLVAQFEPRGGGRQHRLRGRRQSRLAETATEARPVSKL